MMVQRVAIRFPENAKQEYHKFHTKLAERKYRAGIGRIIRDKISERLRDTGANVSGSVSIDMNPKDKQVIISYTIDGEFPRQRSVQIKKGLLEMLNGSVRSLTTEFDFNKRRLGIFGDQATIRKFFREFESRLKALLREHLEGDVYIKTTMKELKNGMLELSIDSDRTDVIRAINELATDEFISDFITEFIQQLQTNRARAQAQLMGTLTATTPSATIHSSRKPKKPKKKPSRPSSQTIPSTAPSRHPTIGYNIQSDLDFLSSIFPSIDRDSLQQVVRDVHAIHGPGDVLQRSIDSILQRRQFRLVDRGQNNLNLLGAPITILLHLHKDPSDEMYVLMLRHYIRVLERILSENKELSQRYKKMIRPSQAPPPYEHQAGLREYVNTVLRPNIRDANWWIIYLIKARSSLARLLSDAHKSS